MADPSRNLARPRRQRHKTLADPHRSGPENARVHVPELRADTRPEAHMREHVLFDAHARRNLRQGDGAVLQLEHGALGNIGDFLAALRRERRAETDLADAGYKFAEGAVAADGETAVLDTDVDFSSRHGAAEDQPLSVLRDIDESARAVATIAEAGDVDVAGLIDFREGEECAGEPAAVVEIELIGLVEDDARIDGGAEFAGM